MKITLSQLREKLQHLLNEAGFPEHHYVIRVNGSSIDVMFDKKEAVDYFKGDFDESDLEKHCVFEYKKEGKRHVAHFYCW